MRNIFRPASVAVLLLWPLLSVAAGKPGEAEADRPEGPAMAAPATPRYVSVRSLGDNVALGVLDNGLTVIVQENHVAPVATVRCFVKNTGSVYEGRHLGAGLSHVLEHVVCGGSTARRTEKEIERIINDFGGATNAYTTYDMTAFYIDCPAKNVMTAVELLADAMQRVRFEPHEFARELRVVRRELADDEVERGRVLDEMLNRTLYAVHPARHPVIGYLEVLNRTTNQAIIDFYHERYVPNNQVFVVVGDFRAQDVFDRVAKEWTGTPRGCDTYVPLAEEPTQLFPREAVREMEGAADDMTLAWPGVKLSDADMYALDLAAGILGEGESSRLAQRLKHDEQLVLSIAAENDTPHYVRGYFAVTASCRPEKREAAAAAILREVYRLREELVARTNLPRRRGKRPWSGFSTVRPCSRRRKASATASSPPPILCSIRPTSRTFRRRPPRKSATPPAAGSFRSGSTG